MPSFQTLYNHTSAADFPTPAGEDVVVDYTLSVNQYGVKELVRTGSHSITEYINSFADSCDINKIIEKCVLTNDYTPLNLDLLSKVASDGLVDTTMFPRTLREVRQLYNDGVSVFNSLPEDERSKYSTFEQFISSYDQFPGKKAPDPNSVKEEVISDGTV